MACTALRLLGHPLLILGLTAQRNDDHVTTHFRCDGLWGVVGKPGQCAAAPNRGCPQIFIKIFFEKTGHWYREDGGHLPLEQPGPKQLRTETDERWFRTVPVHAQQTRAVD